MDETPVKNTDGIVPSHHKNTATTAGDKSESVVEKVSKSLRGKRLRKMGDSSHQGEGRAAGTHAPPGGENADCLELLFSSDALPSHSTPVAAKKRSSKESRGPRHSPARDQEAEGAPEALSNKLSSFTYRPRERLAHGGAQSGPSEPARSDRADRAPFPESGVGKVLSAIGALRDPGFQEEAAASAKQAKKSDKRTGERSRDTERPAEGGKVFQKLRRKATAEERDDLPEGPGVRGKGGAAAGEEAGEEERRRQQLLQRLSSATAGEQLPTPPRATVAPSTLAKLSRFSFTGSPEERPAKPEVTVCERTNSETGQGHDLDPGHAGNNPKKRKCFEFGSKSILPGQSLFSSSLVDDGELDVDWEEESSKRAKV